MADLRYDPNSDVWVAISSKRRERPMEFIPIEQKHQQIICPFCSGNEDETPPPIIAYREDGEPLTPEDNPSSWLSRVVNNKYPSLSDANGSDQCGPYDCSSSDGVQELVIPTPRHVVSISELTDAELQLCFKACQQRLSALREQENIKHIVLFLNCRSSAGASLEHIHFQIMGSPILSQFLSQRAARNRASVAENGKSLIANLMDWELEQGVRILHESDNFTMFCPYASRFAFQVWIVPKDASRRFDQYEQGGEEMRRELSELCCDYVRRLENLLDSPAYNFLVNFAPVQQGEHEHWFVEIFPRLNRMAGYEIGTNIWVNPVPPETAAKRLCSAIVD